MANRSSEVTCPGKCCAVFALPYPRDQLRERFDATQRDREFIADMVIPLTSQQAVERAKRFQLAPLDAQAPGSHFFTCRHWDETSRLCTAYAERPAMCRDYPYDGDCHHGCSYRSSAETRRRWLMSRQSRAGGTSGRANGGRGA
jgi:Fe-S-cluster containining protein